jgi:hypothetical protein
MFVDNLSQMGQFGVVFANLFPKFFVHDFVIGQSAIDLSKARRERATDKNDKQVGVIPGDCRQHVGNLEEEMLRLILTGTNLVLQLNKPSRENNRSE